MTDNSDLLDGTPAVETPVQAPKRRGRPPGSKNRVIVTTDPASSEGDSSVTVTAEVMPDDVINVLDVVPASTTPTSDTVQVAASATLENLFEGAQVQAEAECSRDISDLLSVPEADGSVSVELPPVSAEYAAAQAQRIRIIGQPKREYAYQRVLRAGKRL